MSMWSVTSSSSSPTLERERHEQPASRTDQPRIKESSAKRLMVECARKLHDLGFAFPMLVGGFRAAALQSQLVREWRTSKRIADDPYRGRCSQNGCRDIVEQIPKAVQELDVVFFRTLESSDMLFIDSSHVVGVGSDVVREYLE